MDNFLKRFSSTSTIYNAVSQDKKDHRISVYDNVPPPKNIDKKMLNQFNNYDENEDIRRRIQMLRPNKVYDNVPTPRIIDKNMLGHFNNYDEDEDIHRRSHLLRRRNKLTHHDKKCFCKIENAFLRFD